jgi:antibiotic biosynthesis monooxygenase (ABM) superfamily enzyme
MMLYVLKYDIHPDKVSDYMNWAETAIPRLLRIPGLTEFRGYRPAAGTNQIVTTYEFRDMETWATWFENEEIQLLANERREYTLNEQTEMWGPSPLVPEPIRP